MSSVRHAGQIKHALTHDMHGRSDILIGPCWISLTTPSSSLSRSRRHPIDKRVLNPPAFYRVSFSSFLNLETALAVPWLTA
jgi:hypothetical protein